MRHDDTERTVRIARPHPFCPACGKPLIESAVRAQHYGMVLIGNSLVYRDKSKTLGPVKGRIMEALMETGQASRTRLAACLNDGAMRKTVDVHICHLRKIVEQMTDFDVSIASAFGWGHKLVYNAARRD